MGKALKQAKNTDAKRKKRKEFIQYIANLEDNRMYSIKDRFWPGAWMPGRWYKKAYEKEINKL